MFNHGMRIVFENRIMSNVLFELMNGTKIWYTDMSFIQRGHADKLLAANKACTRRAKAWRKKVNPNQKVLRSPRAGNANRWTDEEYNE